MKENPWLTLSPKKEDEEIYGKSVKCNQCGCMTDHPLPHPQDSKQEIMVCEDCEYEITERASALQYN